MVDLLSLINRRGIDVSFVKEKFEASNCIELFDKYKEVIRYLLFIETKEDYMDFLRQSELNEESFLLAFAYINNLCDVYSANEEDENTIVSLYKRKNMETEKRFVVLEDYRYDDGSFYVFEVSQEEFDDKWNLRSVNRII